MVPGSSQVPLRLPRIPARFMREGLGVVLGCAAVVRTSSLCHCSALIPPRTTVVVVAARPFSDSTRKGHEPSDCPICQKYGNGPCGPFFWNWWDCTERYSEEDSDNQTNKDSDNHHTAAIMRCKEEFARFQICMEKHSNDYSLSEAEDENTLSDWENFVSKELSSLARQEFPEGLVPTVLYRERFGEVAFVDRLGHRSLLAGIVLKKKKKVNDNDNQTPTEVISAAAAPEMIGLGNMRHLAFWKTTGEDNDHIAIVAVYETDDGAFEVFEKIIDWETDK